MYGSMVTSSRVGQECPTHRLGAIAAILWVTVTRLRFSASADLPASRDRRNHRRGAGRGAFDQLLPPLLLAQEQEQRPRPEEPQRRRAAERHARPCAALTVTIPAALRDDPRVRRRR